MPKRPAKSTGDIKPLTALWEETEGSASPLGATWLPDSQSFNFALYSKNASEVTLLAYGPDDFIHPVFTYSFDPLRNKTSRIWHARISKAALQGAQYYAYSVNGPSSLDESPEQGFFNPAKVLLDPYAHQVFFPPDFSRTAACGAGSNVGRAPLGVLLEGQESYAWGNETRPRHDHDLVIYEMHVGGFTRNPNSGLAPGRRGTFLGVIEKIPYLKELGITAVELMPVQQFDASEPNYWGYMTLNFFLPHAAYATGQKPGQPITEFKQMVKALHEADIEVIMDVVYNHTTEGNENGPCFSFRGIDNDTYYMTGPFPDAPYADFTGTGNTLNCSRQAVQRLITDSLRYWVEEMHVDGFRFDLASVFSRNSNGSVNFDDPPIIDEIALEPNLYNIRLIAEPWEGGAQGNYELGNEPTQRSFPGIYWRQWNDQFRMQTRQFLKGDGGLVAEILTRVYGSSDFFPDELPFSYRAYQSLNYISSHDGPTLYDLTAYSREDQQSWNCGWEGDAGAAPAVLALRKQQVKNFITLLLLSNGTPMFRAGDEFLQTQLGDANPYNIDSFLTWLDWNRLKVNEDVFRFFSKMVAFRKSHPSLCRSTFWGEDVAWYGVGAQTDISPDSHSFAFCLKGGSLNDLDLYMMVNAWWNPLNFQIQQGKAGDWKKVVDTGAPSPMDLLDLSVAPALISLNCQVQPRSVVVLASC